MMKNETMDRYQKRKRKKSRQGEKGLYINTRQTEALT